MAKSFLLITYMYTCMCRFKNSFMLELRIFFEHFRAIRAREQRKGNFTYKFSITVSVQKCFRLDHYEG